MAHDNYPSVPSPGPLDLEDEVTFRREVNRLSARHRTSWTAADLMATEFPPVRFAVPGLVPEGLMILGGKPKLGKSWLVLGWACAVAAGGKALSARDVDQGEVLYLALEDSPLCP